MNVKVIGLTSQNKLDFLRKHVDIVVDYRNKEELTKILKKNSFAYYFDNVVQDAVPYKIVNNYCSLFTGYYYGK